VFKREVLSISDVLSQFLRREGLETPLLQRRLIDSWGKVAGEITEKYTAEKFIRSQTLFVRIVNPALRSDLSMMKSELIRKLNEEVGSQIIWDIRFF
jgi:predicted nucleic acid-binding Zn ribbon protein